MNARTPETMNDDWVSARFGGGTGERLGSLCRRILRHPDSYFSGYQSRTRISTPLSLPTSLLSSSKSAFVLSPLR